MTKSTYSDVWDLNSIFPGGSKSPEFRRFLDGLKAKVQAFADGVSAFQPLKTADEAERKVLLKYIDSIKSILVDLEEAESFVSCLEAENMADPKAGALRNELTALSAEYQTSFVLFQQVLSRTSEDVWSHLLQDDSLKEIEFVLNEWREEAREKLSTKEEALIEALAVDGYHGWGQMYDTMVAGMEVTVGGKTFSIGQANNLLTQSNRSVRKEAFEKLEKAWKEKEELFADILNHLAGFRLNVYQKRGWKSFLKEPLNDNRMTKATLDAMWNAIAKHKEPFVRYLKRKAEILGDDRIAWYDLEAPLASSTEKLSFSEGAAFIIRHFAKFGPKLAALAKHAFESSWIEAEDRPGKRPGGFCTTFPSSEESRIFMTYSGTLESVATLAHELGHAFHSDVLRPLDVLNRQYAMNVAETASTLAEMIVADAAYQEAKKKEEKIALLEDKVQRSVSLLMNIHARFLFETRFYEERQKGVVSAERLNALMVEAQQEAYGGALGVTHPHFWASKLHFYLTDVPFYNFPYTFGYLFALSIYARALEEGGEYEEKYIALLRDTAVMKVEDLIQKHLGEDPTKESFWEKGIRLCIQDAEDFLKLTQ
jgi:pepF/M3 family oligoendopeptidase